MIKTYVYGQTLVSVLAPVRSHLSVRVRSGDAMFEVTLF